MKSGEPAYLPALTGVRFLAGLFVFLFHYKPLGGSDHPVARQLVGIFNEMYTGVGLFFVLSGFLICYIYYSGSELKKDFLKKYFVRRFARIFPIFFLLTTAWYIYWVFNGRDDWNFFGIYLANITLIKGFSQSLAFTGIFQTWSLTVEETFYFLAPLIFLIHKKYKIFWLQVPVLFAIGGLCLLIFAIWPFKGFFQHDHFMFMTTFFGRCFEFFVGMKLALILMKSGREIAPARGRFPFATIAGITLIILCLWSMSWLTNEYASNASHAVDLYTGLFLHNFIFPLTVALFFYGLIYERTWVQSFFASRPLELLGKSSYAFYLIHAGFIANFVYPIMRWTWLNFIALQVIAILIFLLIERPLYLWIVRTFAAYGKNCNQPVNRQFAAAGNDRGD